MQALLGQVKVRCNPECATPSKAEALAVSSSHFTQNNGHAVRSYILVIQVRCIYRAPPPPADVMCNGNTNGEMNGETGEKLETLYI